MGGYFFWPPPVYLKFMSGPLVVSFFFFFKEFLPKIVRNIGAILFLFVPCFHFVTLTFVIAMASASKYDSRRHFANMNVKNPYLASH